MAVGESGGPAIVRMHGLLLFFWTILFVVQTRLAQSSPQTHRALGLAGISLATAIVFAAFSVIARAAGRTAST